MTDQAADNFSKIEYPFSAIAGQEEMKLALLLAAIDPGIGGVLLRGEKGTAKSTASRALARLLPRQATVKGCPVGCDPDGDLCPECLKSTVLERVHLPAPFVDLPLGATEDRLMGSLDISAAIKQGRLEFSPGLLARAHRGVLYIDEVNLLAPHLAHLVLDAAASGWARIEREGVSYAHPCQICLIASCNPEEGHLGPQLLDRFGLCVEVTGEPDRRIRMEVLRRRLAFEADPAGFAAKWSGMQDLLAQRLSEARQALQGINVPDRAMAEAAKAASLAGALGQRGELACIRAARAMAALEGHDETTPGMVRRVAAMALVHRSTAEHAGNAETFERLLKELPKQVAEELHQPPKVVMAQEGEQGQPVGDTPSDQERSLRLWAADQAAPIATRLPAKESGSIRQAGRRNARETDSARGRYVRASAQRLGRGLAFDATFRAAAPHQKKRKTPGGMALEVRQPDIREKVRLSKRGRLIMFCVDASGSMNAAARMKASKEAILGLLNEAYQKRDRVGLVAFGGTAARVLLPPTGSVEVARRMLAELPTGGKTPLAAGLAATAEVVQRELSRDPKLNPLVVIFTDGRPNVPLAASLGDDIDMSVAGNRGGGWGDGWGDGGYADREVLNLAKSLAKDPRVRYVLVDIDTGHWHEVNLCRPLADYLGAPCVSLRQLTAERVLDLVKEHW